MTPEEIAAQIARFGDAEERGEAIEILANAGAEAVPALIAALTHTDDHFKAQAYAAATLGRMGEAAISAVPHLIDALRTGRNDGIKQLAAVALGKLGPLSDLREEAHQALEAATRHGNPTISGKAADALAMFD